MTRDSDVGNIKMFYADAPLHQDHGRDPGGRVGLEEADSGGKAGNRENLR